MVSCGFDKLFTKNVPHILENIFFSLDYTSFRECLDVSNSWKELLTSDSYVRRGKSVFRIEIMLAECGLSLDAERGNVAKVKKHLSTKMIDVNFGNGWHDETPLAMAAQGGHKEVVQLLMDAGAHPEMTNLHGSTPLHAAAKSGHRDVVSHLLERGGEPNRANKYGWTPLHEAAFEGHKDVIKVLHQGGAEPNKTDVRGLTPLHYVINIQYCHAHMTGRDQTDMAKLLLDIGANPNATDPDGNSLLYLASKIERKDLEELLLERGAERYEPFALGETFYAYYAAK